MATEVILKMARKMFSFFSTAKRIWYTNKLFPKKKFACKTLIFCVHSVVLDTQKLDFFSISLDSFFQKRSKHFINLYVYVCLDQSMNN